MFSKIAGAVFGTPPLHEAIIRNDEVRFRRLLDNDENCVNQRLVGRLPIHEAAEYGRVHFLPILLGRGENTLHALTFLVGATPLHCAASKGQQEAVEWILKRSSSDLTTKNSFGWTPADVADTYGHTVLADRLRTGTTGGRRGIVHVFNYYKFTDPNVSDFNGVIDGDRLKETFSDLGYDVEIHDNLTKDRTDKVFLDIQQSEDLARENVMLFYILSHGSSTNVFLSSDCQPIDITRKIDLFNDVNCPALKGIPILWFGDFCRGSNEQSKFSEPQSKSLKLAPPARAPIAVPKNTLYFMSSNPGIVSKFRDGSCFTTSFCNMLKEGYAVLNSNWFTVLNERLDAQGLPNTARFVHDPFPGALFSPDEFSFSYDIKKVNEKKLHV